jgi:hypothetical protein
MLPPDLSVIIPIYNRGEFVRYTLESIRRASAGLSVETIIIDDGSAPPVADSLARLGFTPTVLVRQENRGLLFARLLGLARATGRYVIFLDSDDLVSPEKFRLQLAAMQAADADVSYSDSAHGEIFGDYDTIRTTPDAPMLDTTDATEFCLVVQPPPHSPIFRTKWLRPAVERPLFPPSPLYNSVAEVWFYHNVAPRSGRVVRVPGPHSIVGSHSGSRLTNHWEKLGAGSLAVMEAFARSCPNVPETSHARRLVGEAAFRAWRKLPRDFSPEFGDRLLVLWRRLAPGFSPALGGSSFQALARLLGAERAGLIFRRLQARPYTESRTMTDTDFEQLLRLLPPP